MALTDGIIPRLWIPFALTSPPQCSGVPISESSSRTATENPAAAISRAANSPEMLPPATITL
jgi:hypothetical protein